MPITLYELAGADPALRFSPFCWRTRLALAHKGLEAECLPWRFTEKEKIAFSGQGLVPVLRDGEAVVPDSWAIAEYLDDAYPDRPSLLGGGRASMRFINDWADATVLGGILVCVVRDVLDAAHPADRAYFRESRERRFGRTLEEVVENRDQSVTQWRRALAPVRRALGRQPWLGGAKPDYADYILLGSLQWPRCVSRFTLLEHDDPVREWQQRGFALFQGMLAKAVRVEG